MSTITPANAARLHDPPARTRVSASVLAGALTAVVVGLLAPWWLVPLAFWDAAALVYVTWMWRSVLALDARGTARRAGPEDPGPAATDILLLVASITSLLAVGVVLVRAGHTSGLSKGLLLGLSIASIVLSWSVVHTVFALRYAKLYYRDPPGGVDFNQDDPPAYSDFAYLALTIGMTFQVSDTDIQAKSIRRTALRHALLSYMFGALIVSITINLIAGLSK